MELGNGKNHLSYKNVYHCFNLTMKASRSGILRKKRRHIIRYTFEEALEEHSNSQAQ